MSSIVKVSLALAAAVAVALSGVGATYARLSTTTSLGPSATIAASTATLTTSNAPVFDTTALYPGGPAAFGSFTVTNTGEAPVALTVNAVALTGSAAANPFSQSLVVTVGTAANAAACSTATGVVQYEGPIGTAIATPVAIGITLDPAAPYRQKNAVRTTSSVVCLSVRLPSAATAGGQGLSAPFTVTIGGTQVAL